MGAIALLKDFYLLEENTELQGILIQPQQEGGDYMESVASLLKASNVEGWFLNLLLFALNEKPRTKKPSLLVLDDFFLTRKEETRDSFLESTTLSNAPIVRFSKEKHVADCVCSMNGGERIQAQCALKLADERRPLTNPTRKLVHWTKVVLVEAVEYEFSESELESIPYDFIEDGMTP